MTRSELVRQARQGDRDAYDILLTEVVDHLYRIARLILREIVTIRNPERLSEIAAERKPRMRLLPYGVPIATGCICYYIAMGLLV